MVMEENLCSRGRGFEFQHRELTRWTFFTSYRCKNCGLFEMDQI